MTNAHTVMTEVRLEGKDKNSLLSAGDLRDALEAKEVSGVFKYANVEQSRGGEVKEVHGFSGEFLKSSRPVGKSIITSSTIDRDGDSVASSGMVLTDGYKKNPVVLPMHQYREFPIGFTRQITQYAKHVVASWEWLTDQELTKAADYYQLWEARVLNAVSIGFVPLDWKWVEERWGIDFISWELLEHSIVTIPANPDAERSIGEKQYVKLIGSKLIETSPIVRRALEIALADGSTVSVKLPESMKHASENDVVGADAESDPEGVVEDAGDDKEPDVVEASNVEEAAPEETGEVSAEGDEVADSEKSVDEILSAFAAGVIDKASALAAIEAKISKIAQDADLYKKHLADLSISIIESNTEV